MGSRNVTANLNEGEFGNSVCGESGVVIDDGPGGYKKLGGPMRVENHGIDVPQEAGTSLKKRKEMAWSLLRLQ